MLIDTGRKLSPAGARACRSAKAATRPTARGGRAHNWARLEATDPSPITDSEIEELFANARSIHLPVCPGCGAVVPAAGPTPRNDTAVCDDCAKTAAGGIRGD